MLTFSDLIIEPFRALDILVGRVDDEDASVLDLCVELPLDVALAKLDAYVLRPPIINERLPAGIGTRLHEPQRIFLARELHLAAISDGVGAVALCGLFARGARPSAGLRVRAGFFFHDHGPLDNHLSRFLLAVTEVAPKLRREVHDA